MAPAARAILIARSSEETHRFFWQLAAHDAEAINRIGVAVVISAQEDSYWRGRVLQTMFASGASPTQPIVSEYPWESIFAVRRAERSDLIPVVVQLVRDNGSSPSVVAAAIQCFGFLRAEPELEEAESRGLELLNNSPPPLQDFLHIDQALAEIDRFGTNS
jgi:hypothetical protein